MTRRDNQQLVTRLRATISPAIIASPRHQTFIQIVAAPSSRSSRYSRRKKPVHGYKAHVATDQEAGLIRGVEITTANIHDAAELEAVLPRGL